MSVADFDETFEEVLQDVLGWDVEFDDSDGPRTIEAWDSLAQVRIVHELETRCGVRLPDDALLGEQTVGSLRSLVRERAAGS
jgi:acyl carrier protein